VYTVISAFLGFWFLARGFEGYGPHGDWTRHAKRLSALVAVVVVMTLVWRAQVIGVLMVVGLTLLARSEGKPIASNEPVD